MLPTAQDVGIHLVSNPSHLEAVDPVAIGRTRAKQTRRRRRAAAQQVIADHHARRRRVCGAGNLRRNAEHGRRSTDYTVGGSVHIIVNNLIGFTTVPRDIAFFALLLRPRQAPADSDFPRERGRSGCRRARGRIALDYRYAFGTPVVVDLIGYRRHGHSEVDDPTITQPLRYRKIRSASAALANLRRKNRRRCRTDRRTQSARNSTPRRKKRRNSKKVRRCGNLPALLECLSSADVTTPSLEVDTGVPEAELTRHRRSARQLSRRISHPSESEKAARTARWKWPTASARSISAWPKRWRSAHC